LLTTAHLGSKAVWYCSNLCRPRARSSEYRERYAYIISSTILPNVVGRMTAKRKVAGSNLVTDDFSTCNPTYLQLWALWVPGEGVKLGSNSRKADENQSLFLRIKPDQSTLAAKRTVKS
jgi:hypothetical protein